MFDTLDTYWEPADDSRDIVCRVLSPNRRYEIGVYRVMFGYRIRAGYVGSAGPVLDWCCGDNHDALKRAYWLAATILLRQRALRDPFEGVPTTSRWKPYFRDPQFQWKLCELAGVRFREECGLWVLPDPAELKARCERAWGEDNELVQMIRDRGRGQDILASDYED